MLLFATALDLFFTTSSFTVLACPRVHHRRLLCFHPTLQQRCGGTWLQDDGILKNFRRVRFASIRSLSFIAFPTLYSLSSTTSQILYLNCIIMYLKSLILAAAFAGNAYADKRYKYVATFSIDGLHGSDVEKYVALRPKSTR